MLPVPAKRSRKRAPTVLSARILKRASFTWSAVGRIAAPLGPDKRRPRVVPPMMRMIAASLTRSAVVCTTEAACQNGECHDKGRRRAREERPPRYVGDGGKMSGGVLWDGLAGGLRRRRAPFLILGGWGVPGRPAGDAPSSGDGPGIVGKTVP